MAAPPETQSGQGRASEQHLSTHPWEGRTKATFPASNTSSVSFV